MKGSSHKQGFSNMLVTPFSPPLYQSPVSSTHLDHIIKSHKDLKNHPYSFFPLHSRAARLTESFHQTHVSGPCLTAVCGSGYITSKRLCRLACMSSMQFRQRPLVRFCTCPFYPTTC